MVHEDSAWCMRIVVHVRIVVHEDSGACEDSGASA